jgi:hypothetical protein
MCPVWFLIPELNGTLHNLLVLASIVRKYRRIPGSRALLNLFYRRRVGVVCTMGGEARIRRPKCGRQNPKSLPKFD